MLSIDRHDSAGVKRRVLRLALLAAFVASIAAQGLLVYLALLLLDR
jgi:hypothetical protein